jgi:hypothetical protein
MHFVGEANAILVGSVFPWLWIGIVLMKMLTNFLKTDTKNEYISFDMTDMLQVY